MNISDEELKSVLINPRPNTRNHYIANCPFCGKPKHFYINRSSQLFDCKKCGEEGNIVKLLHHIGKLFLLGEFKSLERSKIKLLSEFSQDEEAEEYEEPPIRKMPLGFKKVSSDEYLRGRRFEKINFNQHTMGYSNLIPSLKDYVLFSVIEDGECRGYVARYIKKIAKDDKKTLRYKNDKGAKFSNLIFGYDEIIENKTDTVIIVEGIIDKVTLDNVLELHKQDDIKAVCTFGKKISFSQTVKLLRKGVKNIVLILDYDAIKEMKKHGQKLESHFNVKIGFTMQKDINDSNEEEIYGIFDDLKSPTEFNRLTVNKIKR